MFTYWGMVLVPSLSALLQSRENIRGRGAIIIFCSALFLLMAFRETCGDFYTYSILVSLAKGLDLEDGLLLSEPGYAFLNWLSANIGLGIYGVNAACSVIFIVSVCTFSLSQPLSLLFFALSVPYYVIVVGMGYTRQGVASALLMLSMTFLQKRRIVVFVLFVLLAMSFHRSALIGIGMLLTQKGGFLTSKVFKLGIFLLLGFGLQQIISVSVDNFVQVYVNSDHYKSQGAWMRTIFTAAFGLCFLVFRARWEARYDDWKLWRPLAFLSILLVPLSFQYSTPVDRIGLYIIPFQILVAARLPLLQLGGISMKGLEAGVLSIYMLYFFTWLHLGSYSQELWVPYRWLLW